MSAPEHSDPELQLPQSLQALSQDFDASGPALPLSDAEAARLIAAALQQPQRNRGALWVAGGVPKRRAMGAVALLLLGSSAAAAWYQHRIELRDREHSQAVPSIDERAVQRGATPEHQAPAVASSAVVADTAVAHNTVALASAPEVRGAEAPARTVPVEDLLQKANRLRREGQPNEAAQTYLQLVQREPQSTSAYVARVAVAELRMGRNPAGSIELLQAALRHFPRGPLDIEIHQLLAQGHRATGNAALERSELTLLTKQHPGTLAADRAQARLGELADK